MTRTPLGGRLSRPALDGMAEVNDKESKQIMLRIAKDYELAERAGERLKRRKKTTLLKR